MEDSIKKYFNDGVLDEFIEKYGLQKNRTQGLDGFESFIFLSTRNETRCILRISHTLHRTKEQIRSELQFLKYLYNHSINVPNVYLSENGNLVEEVAVDEGSFMACLFEYVEGNEPTANMITDDLAEKMGHYLGNLHQLSSKYDSESADRPDSLVDTEKLLKYVPNDDYKIIEISNELLNRLKRIPKTKKNYGLCHLDFHFENFLIRDEEIVLFDFDDCQFSWFIHDIAMSLFYYLPHNKRDNETIERGHSFLRRAY